VSLHSAGRLSRQVALERQASPDALTELVAVTDMRGWIAALGLGLLAVAALVWGVFGSITTDVPAQGILVSEGGRLVGAISPSPGIVADLLVRPGDWVERGQVVANVRQAATELRLAQAEQILREREQDLEDRSQALQRQSDALAANARERRAAYAQVLRIAEQRAQRLQRQLDIRQELRGQNLALEERVEQARTDLGQAQQDASEARARMVEIETDLLRARLDAEKELGGLQSDVANGRRAVASLRGELTETRAVLAPATGRVTELTVGEGQLLTGNQLVLNLETAGQRLQAVVYVPTEHGKKVKPGMPVRIALSTVRQEEWGTLLGRVALISDFPSSPQGMAAVLQNPQLVRSFAGGMPPFEARIALFAATTPTGYAWSSGEGPALELTSGTTLRAGIAVRQDNPLGLILPALRRQLWVSR
jgi:HlyD family secretion protein